MKAIEAAMQAAAPALRNNRWDEAIEYAIAAYLTALAEDDAAVERVAMALAKRGWEKTVESDPSFAERYLEDRCLGSVEWYIDDRWTLYVPEARAAIRAMGGE